ncbi:MAG: hypothetical protein MJA30_37825 [Cytophagales bacterium]|nr:hypothetical protein [Cytophagales bacterium]
MKTLIIIFLISYPLLTYVRDHVIKVADHSLREIQQFVLITSQQVYRPLNTWAAASMWRS